VRETGHKITESKHYQESPTIDKHTVTVHEQKRPVDKKVGLPKQSFPTQHMCMNTQRLFFSSSEEMTVIGCAFLDFLIRSMRFDAGLMYHSFFVNETMVYVETNVQNSTLAVNFCNENAFQVK
jgi:hypothetical protein